MVNPTIVSLAFIKTNWDLRRKGYLDNFVPIIAESLRFLKQDIISLEELQESMRQQFGLSVPQSAVEAILKRTKNTNTFKSTKVSIKEIMMNWQS